MEENGAWNINEVLIVESQKDFHKNNIVKERIENHEKKERNHEKKERERERER